MRARMLGAVGVAVLCLALAPAGAVPPGSPEGHVGWSPGTPAPRQDTTFSVAASDPDGVIMSLSLDYGDGTFGTITPPRSSARDLSSCLFGDYFAGTLRHQYSRAGDYRLVLTVRSGGCPLSDALQDSTARFAYTITVREGGGSGALNPVFVR